MKRKHFVHKKQQIRGYTMYNIIRIFTMILGSLVYSQLLKGCNDILKLIWAQCNVLFQNYFSKRKKYKAVALIIF